MIDFGKYKGKSFEYVLNELEDYSYLVWMDEIGKKVPKIDIKNTKMTKMVAKITKITFL